MENNKKNFIDIEKVFETNSLDKVQRHERERESNVAEQLLTSKTLIPGINPASPVYKSDNIVRGSNFIISTIRVDGTTQLVAIPIDLHKNFVDWTPQHYKDKFNTTGETYRAYDENKYAPTVTSGQQGFNILEQQEELGVPLINRNKQGYDIGKIGDAVITGHLPKEDGVITRNTSGGTISKEVGYTILTNPTWGIIDKIIPIRIRKITEREALRLMGLHDPQIDLIFEVIPQKSQRYKLAGNSIVVDVLEKIFEMVFK